MSSLIKSNTNKYFSKRFVRLSMVDSSCRMDGFWTCMRKLILKMSSLKFNSLFFNIYSLHSRCKLQLHIENGLVQLTKILIKK